MLFTVHERHWKHSRSSCNSNWFKGPGDKRRDHKKDKIRYIQCISAVQFSSIQYNRLLLKALKEMCNRIYNYIFLDSTICWWYTFFLSIRHSAGAQSDDSDSPITTLTSLATNGAWWSSRGSGLQAALTETSPPETTRLLVALCGSTGTAPKTPRRVEGEHNAELEILIDDIRSMRFRFPLRCANELRRSCFLARRRNPAPCARHSNPA